MKKEKERALRVQIVDVGEPMVTAVGVDTVESGPPNVSGSPSGLVLSEGDRVSRNRPIGPHATSQRAGRSPLFNGGG